MVRIKDEQLNLELRVAAFLASLVLYRDDVPVVSVAAGAARTNTDEHEQRERMSIHSERLRARAGCFKAVALLLAAGGFQAAVAAPAYNGIVPPAEWPPRDMVLGQEVQPPYLLSPPEVIPIDAGRQLFVDDFLIEQTSMSRAFHKPEWHPASPVLRPDQPWEQSAHGEREGPMAMPFSGGVWYDPADSLFKTWYLADYGDRHLCYATSPDGIAWDKPLLDVVPGTNIVFPNAEGASVVWLDLEEANPERRFKFVLSRVDPGAVEAGVKWNGALCSMRVHFSHDGIHWSREMAKTGPCGDRNSAFWNPFRKQWVFSIRHYTGGVPGVSHAVRCRRYWESPDLVSNTLWKPEEPVLWTSADSLDVSRSPGQVAPELYNLDAVAYESVMLGFFSIQRAIADMEKMRPKINEVCVGFSRDGFHWSRPDRSSFLPVSENADDWNWGNVQSAGGGCLIVGDELRFYASGRRGDPPHFQDADGSTGLAVMRRDGFASMEAGPDAATLTTRPLRFSGKSLFVNVDAGDGELKAEVLDVDGNSVAPFTAAACVPVQHDKTKCEVRWDGVEDLSELSDKPVRFRFHLRQGKLYAFWVSPNVSGASRGYVAAGGPGFAGAIDTTGGN
ncbi:MAG: glycosyl hydrolase family 32 [Candidatus Hydrogenedentes bacterium]|nr:glycosyl hydrolase family 32 [Candidatus Hydrogenedentota bacterium]